MKTVFCDLCGQQLTEAEVEGTVRLPAMHGYPAGELLMWPQIRLRSGDALDACWRCMVEQLLALAPASHTGRGDHDSLWRLWRGHLSCRRSGRRPAPLRHGEGQRGCLPRAP
jgi:hypothetical protein